MLTSGLHIHRCHVYPHTQVFPQKYEYIYMNLYILMHITCTLLLTCHCRETTLFGYVLFLYILLGWCIEQSWKIQILPPSVEMRKICLSKIIICFTLVKGGQDLSVTHYKRWNFVSSVPQLGCWLESTQHPLCCCESLQEVRASGIMDKKPSSLLLTCDEALGL